VKTLPEALKIVKACSDCSANPHVLITEEKIPVCYKHWIRLSESDIEWGNLQATLPNLPTTTEEEN